MTLDVKQPRLLGLLAVPVAHNPLGILAPQESSTASSSPESTTP
jgi:hypothetical protein